MSSIPATDPITPVAAPTDSSVLIGLANEYRAAVAAVQQIKTLIPPAAQQLIDKNRELAKIMQKAKEIAAEAVSEAHQAHASLLKGLEEAEAYVAEKETALKAYVSNPTGAVPPTPIPTPDPVVPPVVPPTEPVSGTNPDPVIPGDATPIIEPTPESVAPVEPTSDPVPIEEHGVVDHSAD